MPHTCRFALLGVVVVGAAAASVAAGCDTPLGRAGGGSGDGSAPLGGDGSPGGGGDDGGNGNEDLGPGASFSVGIGPIGPLNPGDEVVKCVTVRIPPTVDTDVIEIATTLATGSHHLIAYLSSATSETTTPVDCVSFQGVTVGMQPIFIAESHQSTLRMPSGVAWHFAAGQMIALEAHYLNATPAPIMGQGSVHFTTAPPGGTFQKADMMFCGSVAQLSSVGVPANLTNYQLLPGFYSGSAGVDFTKLKIFGLTSHEHWLGSEVTIAKSTSASDPGSPLFDNKSWDNPPLQTYDDAHLLTFNAGEGLRWQCSYDSADAVPKPFGSTMFGESAKSNEMCFIWAYYFPSVGHFVKGGDGNCWQ